MADQVVVWSPEALEDAEAIAAYIARDSVFYAGAVVGNSYRLLRVCASFPSRDVSCPNSVSRICASVSYIAIG